MEIESLLHIALPSSSSSFQRGTESRLTKKGTKKGRKQLSSFTEKLEGKMYFYFYVFFLFQILAVWESKRGGKMVSLHLPSPPMCKGEAIRKVMKAPLSPTVRLVPLALEEEEGRDVWWWNVGSVGGGGRGRHCAI